MELGHVRGMLGYICVRPWLGMELCLGRRVGCINVESSEKSVILNLNLAVQCQVLLKNMTE